MEQLLLHLIGDYLTQTDWMAQNKVKRGLAGSVPALIHALVYGLPFVLLTQSAAAIAVIICTHFLIDHYRLARYVVFFKNKVTNWGLTWHEASQNCGYPKGVPTWMSVWLLIIADNVIHLTINYSALRWL